MRINEAAFLINTQPEQLRYLEMREFIRDSLMVLIGVPSQTFQLEKVRHSLLKHISRAVARALIGGGGGGGGGGIFIYSGPVRLVSFEIKLISKEVSRAEPEYMNIHPPPPQLAF